MTNGGNTLQLKDLDYKDMAGTYKCIVTSIGGQTSDADTLDVYCKYYKKLFVTDKLTWQNLTTGKARKRSINIQIPLACSIARV